LKHLESFKVRGGYVWETCKLYAFYIKDLSILGFGTWKQFLAGTKGMTVYPIGFVFPENPN
jgi:hypothetical protein